MLCGKELAVNACVGAEIRLLCSYRSGVSKVFCPRATYAITHLLEGRTSYVVWLFRERLRSTNSQIFSCQYIIFSSLTKWLRGWDGWNGFAGRIWPAGRSLKTPVID